MTFTINPTARTQPVRHGDSGELALLMDVIVVGAGLIGSAAAKYLAEAGHRVTVFASPEPDPDSLAGSYDGATGPLASHYDEGRITRITDRSTYWADAARRSIEQYRSIEERSGIGFYTERPLVFMTATAESNHAIGRDQGADVELVDAAWLAANTALRVPSNYDVGIVYERSPAGFVNPRRMVQAQLVLVAQAGGRVVSSSVVGVDPIGGGVAVTAADGTRISADHVVLATGAYGAELVGVDLPLERRLRTVALLELTPRAEPGAPNHSPPDHGELPVLIMNDLNLAAVDGVYWVPPVQFPDGRHYLKIGGDALPTISAGSENPSADIRNWFADGGSINEATVLARVAADVLPGYEVALAAHKPCVVTYTTNGLPIVESVTNHVTAAVGGCGAAGKSGDAIGRDVAVFVSAVA